MAPACYFLEEQTTAYAVSRREVSLKHRVLDIEILLSDGLQSHVIILFICNNYQKIKNLSIRL